MAKEIRVKVFDDLSRSLMDAAAYEQGKPVNLRTQEIPPPPRPLKPAEIRRIRLTFNASQALFARFLNVSANTVQSWEQGVRQPDQAALKLLTIAKKHPQAVLSA
jgi:DNA-binding transcriptional regulator YiaG